MSSLYYTVHPDAPGLYTFIRTIMKGTLGTSLFSYSTSLILIAILQRVASASVTVDTHLISSIGKGILVFAAVAPDDTIKEVESMAAKVLKLKMWPDEGGSTVRSCLISSMYITKLTEQSGSTVYKISKERYYVVS